jgi:D-alanyl-lipoteichoic acid acyltransferase DltB (MBOAT superfamily)
LVGASYYFYGCWDWRFLSLIILSTLVDYVIGRQIERSNDKKHRKILLFTSLFVNLGVLFFFKYFNFFVDSFTQAFTFFGQNIEASRLDIILPVGISFYTFQTLSYTIDVYRKKMVAENNLVSFAAYVSFFPQLVAGPIERATNLLPQFSVKKTFDYELAKSGAQLMLWGFFKKVVIADNCAVFANMIFNEHQDYSWNSLILGALFFTFQIYGDFSGYSDIAIGTARLFGFKLMRNFAFPYFSRDIAEFWRRWHISLSTWFRDYLYIPLGGSRGGTSQKIKNTFIIFLVSGFWHGANWTFLVWGALNALYFLPLMLSNRNRNNIEIVGNGNFFISIVDFLNILVTFGLTVIAWIFFRSETLTQAFEILKGIFTLTDGVIDFNMTNKVWLLIGYLTFLLTVEWIGRTKENPIVFKNTIPKVVVWCFYFFLAILVIDNFGNSASQEFIYFDF